MAAGLQPAVRSTTLGFVGSMARVGVEPTDHQGLSLAALPVCVSCRVSGTVESDVIRHNSAPPRGFEPLISTLTGWRAFQAAPRGPIPGRMAQEGFEPSASLILSESGLPVAYRAVDLKRAATSGSQRTTQGGIRTHTHPSLSRAARPVGVPGLVKPAQSRRPHSEAEAVGLEPTSGLRRHLFSRQAPDPAGWLPTVPFVSSSSGGWNRTSGLHVQSVASLPAATTPESFTTVI
jgi:hypothetical protein